MRRSRRRCIEPARTGPRWLAERCRSPRPTIVVSMTAAAMPRPSETFMSLQLYAHPFSSYCQKALVALYENDTPFVMRSLDGPDSPAMQELVAMWPIRRFPVLVDGERRIFEASCIVEYVDLHHRGPLRMI